MTPNMSDRPAASSAYRPPSRRPWITALSQSTTALLDSEVRGRDLVPGKRSRGAFQHRATLEQALHAIGHFEGLVNVLLDQQNRGAVTRDGWHRGIDLLDDHRREAK